MKKMENEKLSNTDIADRLRKITECLDPIVRQEIWRQIANFVVPFTVRFMNLEDIKITLVFLSIHVLIHLFFHPKLDIISEHGDIISEQVDIISEQAAKIGRIWGFEGKLRYFMETRIVKV